MFGALADAGVNIEMISTSEVRITCIIAEDEVETAVRALHEAFALERPEAVGTDAAARPTRPTARPPAPLERPAVHRRQERFPSVGSTNDVVRAWLAEGVPEVCLAVADEQTAGRGREGRTWQAPPGAGLLLSIGFRPTWLAPDRAWRLAAIVSLAMADAAEEVAGLPDQAIRLKWPNDLVVETGLAGVKLANASGPAANALLDAPLAVRKLGGVLGETTAWAALIPG